MCVMRGMIGHLHHEQVGHLGRQFFDQTVDVYTFLQNIGNNAFTNSFIYKQQEHTIVTTLPPKHCTTERIFNPQTSCVC